MIDLQYATPIRDGKEFIIWSRAKIPARVWKAQGYSSEQSYWDARPMWRGSRHPSLPEEAVEWCQETLGYEPVVKYYADRKPPFQVWIKFKDRGDYILFRVKYGEYF